MQRRSFFSVFIFSVVMVLWTLSSLSAQETTSAYNDHGRRDPFWPLISSSGTVLIYDNNVEFSDMILEGIIYDPQGGTLAIINTKIVKPSDTIGGFLVISIEQDHVVLRKDGQDFILRSKKEK